MILKRLLDITVSGLLLLLILPLGLIIALVLMCTGEHEVFYAQRRIGLGGRPFDLLKFVTMIEADIGTGTLTIPDDPRVLPVGRLLRKTKLNELPQLWNVFKGDMSLVGPRPLAQPDFDCYSPSVQRDIVKAKPGLTGVGSIFFRDEEEILAASDLPPLECYREVVAPRKGGLELWYIANCSFLLDVKLLLLTVVAVLAPKSRLHERVLGLDRDALAGEGA